MVVKRTSLQELDEAKFGRSHARRGYMYLVLRNFHRHEVAKTFSPETFFGGMTVFVGACDNRGNV